MRHWIYDNYLVSEGYSLQDIEDMDTDRYVFILTLILETKKKKGDVSKNNPLNNL